MTKRDLILRIAEETGMMQQEIKSILQKALDHIMEAVSRGERVELRRFGIFEARVQRSRIGRNPKRPAKTVVIPRRSVVKFKAAGEFRKATLQLIQPPMAAPSVKAVPPVKPVATANPGSPSKPAPNFRSRPPAGQN